MIYAINQPHFFPYVGFFSLIRHADRFIFFDTPQYKRRGWMNRVKIRRADGVLDFVVVPIVKQPRETPILDTKIASVPWQERIYGQLAAAYKKRAPRYADVMDLVHSVLDADCGGSLSRMAIRSTQAVCEYVGINTDCQVLSEMNLTLPPIKASDEWTLEITRACGGDSYVNLPAGQEFYDRQKFEDAGIEIGFVQTNFRPYEQGFAEFEPGLSIIDMLMFCSNEEVMENIRDYTLV